MTSVLADLLPRRKCTREFRTGNFIVHVRWVSPIQSSGTNPYGASGLGLDNLSRLSNHFRQSSHHLTAFFGRSDLPCRGAQTEKRNVRNVKPLKISANRLREHDV